MPYTSRLQAVLLVRRLREEEAYREWVAARDLLFLEQAHLAGLNRKEETTLNDMAEQQNGLTAEEMALYFRFMRNLRERIIRQAKEVSNQEAICEEKRIVLEQAVRERKGIEQVEEKRRTAYLKTLLKREQAALDEISGQIKHAHVR